MNIFNSTLGHKLSALRDGRGWQNLAFKILKKEKQLIYVTGVDSKIKCVGLKTKASSLFFRYFYKKNPCTVSGSVLCNIQFFLYCINFLDQVMDGVMRGS